MTALRKSKLSDEFRNELARLMRAGLPLLPLGGGADGKAPLLRAWAGPVLPLGRVLAPLHRTGSQMYGVRLDELAVIDCDDDSSELVAAMEARFGVSPVHVKTPRGRHLYYRATAQAPNLRGEGLPVDIKTGLRSYVVGPMSQRPDGGLYLPAKGLLGADALPLLRAPQTPQNAPEGEALVPVGQRHVMLVREALQMVENVDSAKELAANLEAVRGDLCADAATMPDSELVAIAKWTWKCRLENRVFRGRDSAFSLNRLALDALRSCENDTDAIALYVLLQDVHGHTPGKRFALDFKAMRCAGLTRLSIPRLRAARRSLQALGLLVQVGKHRAGSVHQTFSLARVYPNACDAAVISRLSSV
jgi:Bifunctional DNA primase/polymerase, N-terminal